MKTLLRIDSSARTSDSHSRELADHFEREWYKAQPDGKVIRRDLIQEPVPHIQHETIIGFYTPEERMTPELEAATALSDELIHELKSVDEILISSPMYNLSLPSCLKAYLDHVVRIGHTFFQDEAGNHGLLEHKTVHLVMVKGGFYQGTPMVQYDFQEPYLQTILKLIGITSQFTYALEGTSKDHELLLNRKSEIRGQISAMFVNTKV